MSEFKLGILCVTSSVKADMAEDSGFAADVEKSISRHANADFSDMKYQEDIETNKQAIESGVDRIFTTYHTCRGTIWIITEADHICTTVLYPSEY